MIEKVKESLHVCSWRKTLGSSAHMDAGHSRSSTCGFRLCFFCLSAASASSETQTRVRRVCSCCPLRVRLGHALSGSASAPLRFCGADEDSPGLAGLLLSRASAALQDTSGASSFRRMAAEGQLKVAEHQQSLVFSQ